MQITLRIVAMNLFKIDPDENFFKELVDIFFKRNDIKDSNLLNYIFLLPSQQAIDSLKLEFLNRSVYLLPDIFSFGHISQEKIISLLAQADLTEDIKELKQSCSAEEQLIFAYEFIEKHYKNLLSTQKDKSFFINKLVGAANELKQYQIDSSKLANIDLFDMPLHFEQNYRILLSFLDKWQEHLQYLSKIDFIDQSIILLSKLTKIIKTNRLNKKLIIAGTTCSRPSTLHLVKAAYKNKNCQIIVHGLDVFDPEDNIDSIHPQFLFHRLTQELKINSSSIPSYNLAIKNSVTKQKLYSSIFSLNKRESLDHKSLAQNINNLKIIETEDEFEEMNIVKRIILEELHEDPLKKILIISNSPNFSLNLLALLHIDKVYPISNYSNNLTRTKIYEFLWLIYQVLFRLTDDVAIILSLLKHEFFKEGYSHEIELSLRGHKKGNIWNIIEYLDFCDKKELSSSIAKVIGEKIACEKHNFQKQLKALVEKAELISAMRIWQGELGNHFSLIINKISNLDCEKLFDQSFFELLSSLLANYSFNEQMLCTSNVFLYNTVGSRLVFADIVIISSFNEKLFPDLNYDDSMIPSFMRKKLSLPTEDFRVSQQAYDFYCHLHKEKIFITRAKRSTSGLSQESRWLTKLKLLAKQNHFFDSLFDDKYLTAFKNKYITTQNKEYTRPAPSPATSLRPTRFSATELEKLVRDPYFIYCKKILKLKEIDPINKAYNQMDYGNLIHAIFEKITEDKDFNYLHYFEHKIKDNQTKAFWKSRIENAVKWIKIFNRATHDEQKEIRVEHKAELKYIVNGISFEIVVKSDRIETKNNCFSIIDFKTSRPPTNSDIHNYLALQLQIGAFGFIEKGFKSSELQYIELKIGRDSPIIHQFKPHKDNEIDAFIVDTKHFILNLLDKQYSKDYIYITSMEEKLKFNFNPYSHLARI